ncbi:LptF/LptG family permease [Longimonas halophila]|uniref:LptF/LptG family permease n=1 Tax=Longimonas halophila TaxID=1469170 RepID=UPI001FE63420|nr:LptF/LptG family permease [Longimonas halophila]
MPVHPPRSYDLRLTPPSVTRFDWHIVARVLKGFALFVSALIVFFIVLHWVEYNDDFVDRGADMSEIFRVYYPAYIPEIVRLISPLAIFLSCIYVTGKLAQEVQLIALQTSGVSLYRLMRPYLLVGVTLTLVMFGFNGWVVPRANEVVVQYDNEYLHPERQTIEVSEIHRQNDPRSIVSVGYYDTGEQRAHHVSLQRFDEQQHLRERFDADRMDWVDSLQVWRMVGVTERTFPDDQPMQQAYHSRMDTTLQITPRDLARTARDVEAMTVTEARYYLESLQRSGAGQLGRPLVAYYNKFAYPVANLILVLIAVPLAAVRRRGGQAVRFGIGLFVALLYLAAQKLSEPFGYAETLDPWLTTWIPHALFATVALLLLLQARK